MYLDYGTDEQRSLPSKVTHMVLNFGENVRIETGGAGGLGNPSDRLPESVRLDFENGFISRDDLASYKGG